MNEVSEVKNTYMFMAKGFEEIEAITVADILRRAEINCRTVSMESSLEVEGGHGIKVICDEMFNENAYSGADMLILPGGGGGVQRLKKHKALGELLIKYNGFNNLIAAICAAPSVLSVLGLLKGKEATSYPGSLDESSGAVLLEDSVVVSGNIITSRGAGTAAQFALKLAGILAGEETAAKVGRATLYYSGA